MLEPHYGLRHQTGRGLGSLFSGLLRGLKPLAKMGLSAGKRFLQSDFAKNVGSTALNLGKEALKNVAVDVLEGKNLADAGEEQLALAKQKIATQLKGSGCRKRKRRVHSITNRKQGKYSLLN